MVVSHLLCCASSLVRPYVIVNFQLEPIVKIHLHEAFSNAQSYRKQHNACISFPKLSDVF